MLFRRSPAALFSLLLTALPGFISSVHSEPLPEQFDLRTTVSFGTSSGSAALRFNTVGPKGYLLSIEHSRVRLFRTHKQSRQLIAASTTQLGEQSAAKITVQRRRGRISVLLGPRLLLSVEDATFSGGGAGITASGGARSSGLHTQPVETLYFADDFMRQPDEPGEWTYETGKWSIETLGVVQRSANPFSLISIPAPRALATTGYSFWTDYAVEAAARGTANNGFGICADVQDSSNYYLLKWSPGARGALELLRVTSGKSSTLAHISGGFIPDRWYQLCLRTSAGRLLAEIDHQPIFSVSDTTFGAGKAGLYSEGTDENPVHFDSILIEPAHWLYQDFRQPGVHLWQTETTAASRVSGPRTSYSFGGSPEWQNYSVTAQTTGISGTGAILLRCLDAKNHYSVEWGKGSFRIVAVRRGRRTILAKTALPVLHENSLRVEAGADDGYLWGSIDGKRLVECVDFTFASGRVGFLRNGSSLRSMGVRLAESPEPTDALTAEFTDVAHHPEMQGWAGPLNAWEDGSFGADGGYWHKGSLYGDLTITVPLIPRDLQDGSFSVILRGDGRSAGSGYELYYKALNRRVTLSLLRRGTRVARGIIAAPTGSDEAPLQIDCRGAWIYVRLNGHLLLSFRDTRPLGSYSTGTGPLGPTAAGHTRLGLIVRGDTPLDIAGITLLSSHVYAETFHLAPVNWRPQGGSWEVTRRWSCQPGWTWYGGKGLGYCANWCKASLWGDQSIDYYAAAMMSATDTSGREAWRDFNCSFCSDGSNLFSGYTLIVAGWNNSVTRLFRKGKVVAENSDFHFPPRDAAHRLWFDIHIAREGSSIEASISFVDLAGRKRSIPLIHWNDPAPIAGGYVGYWTYNNGFSLARTVLSFQKRGPEPLYTDTPYWTAELPENADYPNPELPRGGLAALPSPPTIRPAASRKPLPVSTQF